MEQPEDIPVGIDLGTTYSVIAHLDREGHPWTIRNSEGDPTTPSAVFFDRSSVIVGKEALKLATFEPDRVALCAKRDIGSQNFSKPIVGESLPPEVIEACVLRKLRRDAELVLGPFDKVVITVPAYFNEPRRKATQDAGRIAGLDVIDIINEPTAAAIAAGAQQGLLAGAVGPQCERVLVFDLGGGTFDVTVMEIKDKGFQTLATGGDMHLGGMDWDQRLSDHLFDEFHSEHGGEDLREQPLIANRLLREAEEAKRTLSVRDETTLCFEHEGARSRLNISRSKFEDLTRDLVERTRFTTTRVLREGRLKWADLTRVLVVGGSTRMPMILHMLERESGRKLDRSVSADEAVAHGAALYAGLLLSGVRKSSAVRSVVNVCAHNMCVLGVDKQTGRRRSKVMIPRNSTLPASVRNRFHTSQPGQTSVVVQIVEGGDASGSHSTPVGRCVISELPVALPANAPVDVMFTYTPNGRLIVEAAIQEVGAAAKTTIERTSGLIDSMLKVWEAKLESGRLLSELAPNKSPAKQKKPPVEEPIDDQIDDASEPEPESTASFDFDEPEPRREKPKSGSKSKNRSGPAKPRPEANDDDFGRFLESLE